MNQIEQLRQTRRMLSMITDRLSDDQLMKVPQGYANNILWQMGHIVVVQQRLLYSLCSLDLCIPDHWLGLFAPGTSPADWSETPDIAKVKEAIAVTVDHFEADMSVDKFSAFQPYFLELTKIQLESFEDAINFNMYHEGVHTGMIMSMRRLV